jgi:tyrosinase
MFDVTRRGLLAAAVLLGAWLADPVHAQQPLVRHDARSPKGQAMLKIYAKAVAKMKATPEGDPNSWTFQWYTHAVSGATTRDAELKRIYPAASAWRDLAEEMWETCQAHHPGEDPNNFLPWHRMYLYYFEQIVRDVSGEKAFTLPYWNYSTPDQKIRGVLPPEFTREQDPLYQSLYVGKRNPGVNQGQPIHKGKRGDPLSLEALAHCFYEKQHTVPGFCADLDNGLHGNVHDLIGNDDNMGAVPFAAYDPIFWLHHCNVDRLWASWNAAGRTNPTFMESFVFAKNKLKVVAKCSDFVDTARLGYVYDRLEPVPDCPPATRDKILRADNQPKRVGAVKSKEVKLAAGLTRVVLEPLSDDKDAAPMPLPDRVKGLRGDQHLYLLVKNLRADLAPGVLYELFLDLPEKATEEQANAHYIGTINFFNAVAHGGHGKLAKKMPERFYRFDITALARSLQDRKMLSARPTLSIVPAGKPAAQANPVIGEVTVVQQ